MGGYFQARVNIIPNAHKQLRQAIGVGDGHKACSASIPEDLKRKIKKRKEKRDTTTVKGAAVTERKRKANPLKLIIHF